MVRIGPSIRHTTGVGVETDSWWQRIMVDPFESLQVLALHGRGSGQDYADIAIPWGWFLPYL